MAENPKNAVSSVLAEHAQSGRFTLQKCAECGTVAWPPRKCCASCWSADLEWRPVSQDAVLLAETTLHSSNDRFFQERLPWRIGVVKMEAGPVAYAHLSAGVREGDRVRLVARADWRARGVLIAIPVQGGNIEDDPKLKELIDCQNTTRED